MIVLLTLLIHVYVFAQSWKTPVNVSNTTSLNSYPGLAIDTNNIYHVVWTHMVSPVYWILLHSQSNNEGSSWSVADTVLNIPDSWLFETHLVCNKNNELIVTFDSISWGGTYTQVYAIIYNGISWSAPIKLSSNNNAKANKPIVDNEGRVYCFWHEIYNGNGKFMYRIYEDCLWGETIVPYTDSNVYVLENLHVDRDNNIHAIGYFHFNAQTSDDFVTAYYLYGESNNQWESPYIISNNKPFKGCDIVTDTFQLPHTVTNDYINLAPIDYASLHRNQSFLGWESPDTVTSHKEEYYPQIEINAENDPDFIIAEMITNDNLMLKNYFKIDDAYIIELIDNNGSIMFKNLQRYNTELKLVYGKMPVDAGLNSDIFITSKSIHVGIIETEKYHISSIFPNPCSTELNICIAVVSNCVCSVSLVDILGRTIQSKDNVSLLPGNNYINVHIKRSNNSFSTYSGYLVIRSNKFELIKPVIIKQLYSN